MKLTRRELVGAVISGAALAQTQPAQSPPATPEEESKFVAAEAQRRAEVLAEFPVPVQVEPAFEFKA
jgi:hypothetical protein